MKTRLFIWLCLFSVHPAWAYIPGNQNPTTGGDKDNILKTFFAYAYDALLYGGPIGIAFAVIYYLIHMWGIFQEIRAERKTKNDFITDGIIGASLILLSIWGVNYGLNLMEKV